MTHELSAIAHPSRLIHIEGAKFPHLRQCVAVAEPNDSCTDNTTLERGTTLRDALNAGAHIAEVVMQN